jgi:release factor glutamine methyltransferase
VRRIFSVFIRPLVKLYLRKERWHAHDGVRIKILPGVFHPGLFFSTQFLLDYLQKFDLRHRSLLEVGAGSALISFVAEKKGAIVTAIELSKKALEGIHWNRDNLSSSVKLLESDVFDRLQPHPFDFIVINPPYFPKQAKDEWQLAWYCGEQFEFFEKVFSGLKNYLSPDGKTLIVLSEDCDIFTIAKKAEAHGWRLVERSRKKIWLERNYIFECQRH